MSLVPWYVSAFGELYEDLYRRRDTGDARRAVDFLRREGLLPAPAPGGRVLDLCCGAGRHALLLAGEDGTRVTGFDLAANLLAKAQRQAAATGVALPLVRGDMRHLPFASGSFALVVNLFTSFGYFDDEAENGRVLGEVARVLAARGGCAVLDLIHPAYLRAHLVPESERTTPTGRIVREWRRYDPERRRVEKRMEVASPGGSVRHLLESVRCYEPPEVAALANAAGLRTRATFGDFDSRPLTSDAPRAIYVLECNTESRREKTAAP